MRTINLIQNLSKMDMVLQNKITNIDEETLTDNQYLELAALLAREYDRNSTYKLDEFCIYNNAVYSSNTTILIPEDFNSSHWDLIGQVNN